MKAMQVNPAEQGPGLILADLPKPEAGTGEILVHVHATGVTPAELLWYPTTHTKSGTTRTRAVPTRRLTIRPRGSKKKLGPWMSSSIPSAATRSSGHGVSSSQADAWSP